MAASAPPHITHTEWSTLAPAIIQHITAGPGVAPAKHMAEHGDELLPFSEATTVVDMGCGPGQVTNAVLEAHHAKMPASVQMIGADNNAQMMVGYTMRQKTEVDKGNTYWQRAKTLEVDIHDCAALPDDSVSHMLCGFVLFLVPEPAKAISAMKRVMAPGGVLAVSSLQTSEWMKLSMYPSKIRPDLAVSGPGNGCSSAEDVTNHLKNSGFKDIEVIQIENYMEFNEYDSLCRFLLTKLPMTARIIAQMTNEEVLKTHALMVEDVKSWYPTLPARLVGKVNIAYCRK
ncbi:S-adenosyl-L-methionine-dependent methyltransferase [Stachybotrys elegans]|uniref:S-adenosyl-L-methionine-dependent methyltransferase n=1 Tax=Stachybotrys elegans TaxID=80388 RepID=A0A8K0WIU2_9HYPO|nr:S-adenosyl-L-methionine-dependent methyltransferase [Stachybotrys elegans]